MAAAGLAAFALDLVLPHGIADGTLYIALVLSALWMPAGGAPFAMAAAASLLTAVGFLVSPEGEPLWMALTDRGVSVAVIWVVAQGSRMRNHELNRMRDSKTEHPCQRPEVSKAALKRASLFHLTVYL